MVGRVAMCSFGLLVGLSAMRAEAQAPIESSPGTGSSRTQPAAVGVPAQPCRQSLFGPGFKGIFGAWCRRPKGQPPVACQTCEPAPAVPPVRSPYPPTPARAPDVVPASGWAEAARPTPVIGPVILNDAPEVQRPTPPAVLRPVPAAPAPTRAEPPLVPPAAAPYTAFIEHVQTTQEKDARALREVVERRQAGLALIRALQAADANTVAALEKLLRQMKEDSPRTPPVPPTVPAPAPPAPPVAVPAGPSPGEIQALLEQLDRLAQKVNELAAPMPHAD